MLGRRKNMDKNKALFIWYRYVGGIFRLLPIKKGRIVAENFFGKGYGDNPKYIYDELLTVPKLELIWLIKEKHNTEFPPKIKIVRRGTLKELYYLATAQIWIDNSRKHYGIKKRNGQLYIQTWHGGIALKKIEKDVEKSLPLTYIKAARHDSNMIDILLSGSEYFTKIFRRSFWYDGEIYNVGLPRTDIFFKNPKEYIMKVYQYYKLPETTKLVLYAPTFRDHGNLSAYDMDYDLLLRYLDEFWKGEWKLIIRLHPNISKCKELIRFSDYIIDGTDYPDINHLILASDLLITDYSSCMFDAVYASKKVIIYASDQKEYFDTRGTYFDYSDLPFPVAENMDELRKKIEAYKDADMREKYKEFLNKLCSVEQGNASQKIAKRIVDYVNQ